MPKSSPRSKKPAALGPQTRVLVLHGVEDVLKREHFEQLRKAVCDAEGADIEPVYFDGKAAAPAEVFDELRTLGMFQHYRLVVVERADEFVTDHRPLVEAYAANPAPDATLVLRSVKWNSPNLDKLVAKVGAKIKCDLASASEAARWLIAQAKSRHDITLSKPAAETLVARLGRSLGRLGSELGKLAVLVGTGRELDDALINEIAGHGSDDNAWVVQEAILAALASAAGGRGGKARDESVAGAMIEAVHELIDVSGQNDVAVLVATGLLFRELHLAAMMRKQGMSQGAITGKLRLWGGKKDHFFVALDRLKPQATARLLRRIVLADGRAKHGFGEPTRNLECFAATLADEMN